MILSLAILIILSLIFSRLFEKMQLPGLIGMLIAGILIGDSSGDYFYHILNNNEYNLLKWVFVNEKVFQFSPEFRNLCLIIILFRAGLGIDRDNLKKIGYPALKMSIIPGLFEASIIMYSAHIILNLPIIETSLLAFVIAAVSPAVIVPAMLNLKENGIGNKKDVPTLVLASASIDDLVAISLFGVCLSLNLNSAGNSYDWVVIKIPSMIISGILFGYLIGLFFIKINNLINLSVVYKFITLLVTGIFLCHFEKISPFPFSSLLSIITIAYIINDKDKLLSSELSKKFNNLWKFSELLLFSLIGAEVDVTLAFEIGLLGLLIFLLGLFGRSIGVWISLVGSILNKREKLFCVMAFLPKATVQAAIGGTALAVGIASGGLILSMAVLSILVTAPLGSIAIKIWAEKLLQEDDDV